MSRMQLCCSRARVIPVPTRPPWQSPWWKDKPAWQGFPLGANLVLTKPIHVEQSKGTLRVARGLLRKGQAAKPAGTVSAAEPVVAPPSTTTFSGSQSPNHRSRRRRLPRFRLGRIAICTFDGGFSGALRSRRPPAASASAFELDAEPTPQPDTVDAALLEYMPDSAPAGAQNSNHPQLIPLRPSNMPGSRVPSPWPSRWLRRCARAAEVAGKTEFETPAASSTGSDRAIAARQPLRHAPGNFLCRARRLSN